MIYFFAGVLAGIALTIVSKILWFGIIKPWVRKEVA